MPLLRLLLLILIVTATTRAKPTIGPFLEVEAPFLCSALLLEENDEINAVRRGILIPLGENHWACFDTDLLRWAAVWKAPAGRPPLTLDSMAAISYPQAKAKAKSPPRLVGELVFLTPPTPGAGPGFRPLSDTRSALASDPEQKVGPLPKDVGRWLGLEMRGTTPVFRYRIADAVIEETLERTDSGLIRRLLRLSLHQKPIHLNLGGAFSHRLNSRLESSHLLFRPAERPRQLVFATGPTDRADLPTPQAATPVFSTQFEVTNPDPSDQGPYRVRPLALPSSSRYLRPTDLDFLADGTGLLTTLEGDLWRIETPEGPRSRWTRVASGLHETIAVEVTPDQRIFTLGRNQITELIDHNADGHFDVYRNASNAFHQTIHTRDYATSLAIGKDRSFFIAKGGIHDPNSSNDNELSAHRGTVLKISPDGNSATVLADGLRLPYVGLRDDGAVFASDQQGHHVPSTPLHLIGANRPFLGFAPTNFRRLEPVPPLLWYPYQANRSAAAFASWDDLFLQVSWSGRLFAVETPATGSPFSWQLPLQLAFPSLNAARNPKSGRLYAVGLGISGYKPTTPELLGIASIEAIIPFPKPVALVIQPDQIAITFDRPLTEDETLLPASPALRLFDLKRSSKYGSGHFRWDGKPGEYRAQPTSLKISPDRRTFTLGFDPLFRSHLLDLHLTLTSSTTLMPLHLFARPDELPPPGPGDLEKLATREAREPVVTAGDPARGKALFTTYSCAGCHSLDGSKLVGPSLRGIASRAQPDTLRQAILEPNAVITAGFPPAMPSFAGVLTDQQLADLLAYLATLR